MNQPVGIPPNLRRQNDSRPPAEYLPLAYSLSQNQFVGMASDRQAEARQYTGWNYVAINAVCKLGSRAEVAIYDDRLTPSDRKSAIDRSRGRMRRHLRDRHGDKWKSYSPDPTVMQQADPSFRWWALLSQPSPWQSGAQLRYSIIQQLRLHGVAIVWNVKDGFGKTMWRLLVPMACVTPIQPGSREGMPFGGVRVHSYGWMMERFGVAALGRNMQVIAARELSNNDLSIYSYPHPFIVGDGASPTAAMADWLELSRKATASQADAFDRGPDKKAIVAPPDDVQTDAQLRAYGQMLDRRIRETRTGVIVAKADRIHDLSVAPDEMGYETASSSGDSILAGHGAPKAAVGISDGMTYGSVTATLTSFGTLSVQPDLDLIAADDTLQMREEEGSAFTIEYTVPSFDDPELSEARLENDMAAGGITVGEWRTKRGMDLFGDERDDMLAGSDAIKKWSPSQRSSASGSPRTSMAAGVREILGGTQAKSLVARGKSTAGSVVSSMARPAKPYVVAVELDGVLSYWHAVTKSLSETDPRLEFAEVLRVLRAAGCQVVIYTARDDEQGVADWLDRHGFVWDAINDNPWSREIGGPLADLVIDSRSVNAGVGVTSSSVIAQAVSATKDDGLREAIQAAVDKMRFSRMYGFLFVPVEGRVMDVVETARQMVQPEHLAGDGFELDPHVTLLHAVADGPAPVIDTMRAIGQFQYGIGRLDVFRNPDSADGVAHLVIQLEGDQIHDVWSLCSQTLTHVPSEHAHYRPHITIAQINAEYTGQYDGRALPQHGALVSVKQVAYRPAGGHEIRIPLRGQKVSDG